MKGHDPHTTSFTAGESFNAGLHLFGGFVRKSNRQYPAGILSRSEQMRDPVRKYSRLSRAGPRQYEQRTLSMRGSLLLHRVQIV
jgi:hypothetical protein